MPDLILMTCLLMQTGVDGGTEGASSEGDACRTLELLLPFSISLVTAAAYGQAGSDQKRFLVSLES